MHDPDFIGDRQGTKAAEKAAPEGAVLRIGQYPQL